MLSGKVILVTGATGIVGGGMARVLLQEGATVIAPLRSESSRHKLDAALQGLQFGAGRLLLPLADWGKEEGATQLARFISEEAGGAVDHVVSICAGSVPLCTATALDLNQVASTVRMKLAGHVLLARHVLPLVKDSPASSYTIVSGMAGEVFPMPDLALLALCNCSLYGFVGALQAEKKGGAPRIIEMRIGAVICRDGERCHPEYPDFSAFPASKIGSVLLKIASGAQRDEVIKVTPKDLA